MSPSGGIALAHSAGGARADLRIARPPVNVLDAASLHAIAREVRAAGAARLLVLTGLPAAFSAGVDVAEHAPEAAAIATMLAAMREVLEALVASPAVTLAAVQGACLGGGAEIVAACDLVLLADDARVGFPEIRLACFPPGAAALLPASSERPGRRIGSSRAAPSPEGKPPTRGSPRARSPLRASARKPSCLPGAFSRQALRRLRRPAT